MKLENCGGLLFEDIIFNKLENKGGTSDYYTDPKLKYFVKKPNLFLDYDILKREIYIYKLLNNLNFSWCPKLIYYNDQLIVTEYLGEEINEVNIPTDYQDQIRTILNDLKSFGIKHNDILKGTFHSTKAVSEILVNNGTLYLVDFGWATINDDFSLGQPDISKSVKPCGVVDDEVIISHLDNLYQKKCQKTVVRNRRNNIGSQIEAPTFKLLEGTLIKIGGYQKFDISKEKIIPYSKRNKYQMIEEIMKNLHTQKGCITMVDIGCSAGILCYLANQIGYLKACGLDHDKEYINLMSRINKTLEIDNVYPSYFSFGDHIPESDVVIMCALIHWVYSCTSLYGNFSSIFQYLRKSVKKYLLIEWVGPNDGAIKFFKHTNYNEDQQSEEYCKENLEKNLVKFIGPIINIKYIEGDRYLYLVKKD
jgi:SAM-dependent methyltransferase/tRNA A-37 threonylcarbamoyl transferase component Bud32